MSDDFSGCEQGQVLGGGQAALKRVGFLRSRHVFFTSAQNVWTACPLVAAAPQGFWQSRRRAAECPGRPASRLGRMEPVEWGFCDQRPSKIGGQGLHYRAASVRGAMWGHTQDAALAAAPIPAVLLPTAFSRVLAFCVPKVNRGSVRQVLAQSHPSRRPYGSAFSGALAAYAYYSHAGADFARVPSKAPSLVALRHSGKACGERGVTLVELLVVIVMIAVLLGVAIAGYQHFTTSNTVVAELHSLKQAISLARSQAVTLGDNVMICASDDAGSSAPTCSGTNEWDTGWVVLLPTNGVCTATSGQPVAAQASFRSQDTAVFTSTAGGGAPASFCFDRDGFPASAGLPGMFVFNTKTPNAEDRLCLAMNAVGHLKILSAGQGGCP